jgi:hypothetical protein
MEEVVGSIPTGSTNPPVPERPHCGRIFQSAVAAGRADLKSGGDSVERYRRPTAVTSSAFDGAEQRTSEGRMNVRLLYIASLFPQAVAIPREVLYSLR